MFWAGAALGAFVVLVIIAAGLGMMFYSVVKEREKEAEEGNRYKVEKVVLYRHWDEANRLAEERNDLIRQHNGLLGKIAESF